MNRIVRISASCLALSIGACFAQTGTAANVSCCPVAPYFSIRSQRENNPRLFVGHATLFNLPDVKDVYGNFVVTSEYTKSMRPGQIAENLFGDSLYNKRMLKIKGSKLPHDEQKDLLANYLYLSDYYDGTLCFTPRIQNYLVDLNLYLGLGVIAHGMYLRVHAPVVWTKWDLGVEETVINDGNISGSSFFNSNVTNFFDYACKGRSTPVSGYQGTNYPLGAAKICPCSQRKTALSDPQIDLGWNFAAHDRWHTGLYVRGVIPTGTRPNGRFLFEPIIGNGKHWELGGGIDARWIMWRSDTENHELGMYFDASITHLFQTKQKRVFDLKNHGPLSRYMLLYNAGGTTVTPAANLTLTNVNVSAKVQADIMLMLNYTRENFNWDFGYNLWARSCEQIDCCKLESCQVCNHSSICNGLDGATWFPYTASSTIHTYGAGTPVALTKQDLDLTGAQTKELSNKLFTNFGYTWWHHDDRVIPFLGIGAEVEIGKRPSCCGEKAKQACCAPCSKKCCQYCALSQWGVWLNGGISF